MCSSRWLTPISSRDSCTEAERTQIPAATERTVATRSDRIRTPFGAMVWKTSRSSRLRLLEQRLARQAHAAAVVHLQQLHADLVALLHHVLGPLRAAMLQLGDVQQPLDAR